MINDNWRDTREQELIASGLEPTNDLESAIVATLDPGLYTVIVRSKDDESFPDGTFFGGALVEVYDLDQAASRLANISTRGFLNPATTTTMIGRVIIGGNTSDTNIVVRGIGPSLADVGVVGAPPDPAFGLSNENGDVLAINDNWQDDPGAAQIEAADLAPDDPLEAAVLVTLPPGLTARSLPATRP